MVGSRARSRMNGIDAAINAAIEPLARWLSAFIFYSVPILGAELPLVVLWLIAGALFFTLYFGFIRQTRQLDTCFVTESSGHFESSS